MNWLTMAVFGAAALIAGGCAPLTDEASGTAGGGCIAAIVQDDAGAQVPINKPGVTLGAGTGTTTQLAEAFLMPQTQVVSEVQLKLDVVTPAQVQLNGTVFVQIAPDSLGVTTGTTPAPTTPLLVPATSGSITATGSISASKIIAGPTVNTTNPAFYDFCFPGAIGVNCPSAGSGATTAGVTLNAGQIYWVMVTTAVATSTSFVEWRGTKTSTPNFFGYVFLNALNWLPVNGVKTSNFNFDFKLGC